MTRICKSIVENKIFNGFIISVIVIASILVGVETNKEFVEANQSIFDLINHLILFIFVIEMVIKILAKGNQPWQYFYSGWNLLDFFIVMNGLIDPLLNINASFVPVLRLFRLFRLFRLLRVLRVLRLVTAFAELQFLVATLLRSVTAIGYVGIFLILIFYIYGTAGVLMFGLNDPLHFGDLPTAILTLFGVITTEGWVDLLYLNIYGCLQYPYGYEDAFKAMCANPSPEPAMAIFYFVSFIAIGTMIVLNLFIGVIMNSMEDVKKQRELEDALEEKQGHMSIFEEINTIQQQIDEVKISLDTITEWLKEAQPKQGV